MPAAADRCAVQATKLLRLIESDIASTVVVIHVLVSKFVWHLALYRQVEILAGQGIHFDRRTLAGYIKPCRLVAQE